jgi:hypothetical protein
VSKQKARQDFLDPVRGPVFSVRCVVALVLIAAGIAWMAYYYLAVRVDPTVVPAPEPGSPAFMADLGDWNYLIGFGAILVGPAVAAASWSGCSAAS